MIEPSIQAFLIVVLCIVASFLFNIIIQNAFCQEKFRIKEIEIEETYYVQMRKCCFWITIKEFHDTDKWWAEANAKNLLDELNKQL